MDAIDNPSGGDGGVHALDLASEAVWAMVWERLDGDAKRALSETSRALHDLALERWHEIHFFCKGADSEGHKAWAVDPAAAAFNRLRSASITLVCWGPAKHGATLRALLAALQGGAAARITTLDTQLIPCRGSVFQQLRPFTNLHTLVCSIPPGSDPADIGGGLAALAPSLTSLDVTVVCGTGHDVDGSPAAALRAVGAAADRGCLAGLLRLTAKQCLLISPSELQPTSSDAQEQLQALWQLTALTALRELELPSVDGTLDADWLPLLQPLGQLPRLDALSMQYVTCRPDGLAALAQVRPWTRLELSSFVEVDDSDDEEEEDSAGEWTFPALRTLCVSEIITLQRMEQVAAHSPALAEVLCCGLPACPQFSIPAAATAKQAAAELRRLLPLHDRGLLRGLLVRGSSNLPPVAVLEKAAAPLGPQLVLPAVDALHVMSWYKMAGGPMHQHLSWLLRLLPNVRTLRLGHCSQLTDGGALAALQQHMLRQQQQQQQQPGGAPTMHLELGGYMDNFLWAGLCAWAMALPAGRHAPLYIHVRGSLGDIRRQPLEGVTLTRDLKRAGRGYVTVECRG